MSFVSPAVKAKSDESIFVPGKIVLPSEGKLRQLSLETIPQLEQTKLRPPRLITQRGALGPFSANIRRLFSSFCIRSVSFCAARLLFDLHTLPSQTSKISPKLTFFLNSGFD